MPVILANSLPAIAFSRNPIPFVVQSSDYQTGADVAAVNKIALSGSIAADTALPITWGAGAATMTAKASPDDSGEQFASGTVNEFYVQAAREAFAANYFLDRDFVITGDLTAGAMALIFTARKPGANYNFTPFSASGATGSNTTAGTSKSTLPNFAHHLEIWVETDTTGEYELAHEANTALDVPLTGKTSIDIGEDALHGFLSPDMPVTGALYALCVNSIRRYYCKFAQYFDEDPSIKKITTTSAYYVAYGGLSIQQAAQRDLVAELNPLSDNGLTRFMRQGSKNKLITTTQPEWLTYLNITGSQILNAALEVTIYNDDETSVVFNAVDSLAIAAYQKIQFQCGYTQLSIGSKQGADKKPVYYTCRVKAGTDYFTDVYAFVIDYNYYAYPRYFVYLNAYGAYQTMATVGKQEDSFDRKKTDGRLAYDMRQAAISGDFIESNITIRDKYAVNVGYARSGRRVSELFRDFALSSSIFLYQNGRLVPVQISSNSIKIALDGEYLYAKSFEYTTKYEEISFSEDPYTVTDDTVSDLLGDAGTPPAQEIPEELSDGYLVVEYLDPKLSFDAGKQVYTNPYWLAGRTGYRIWTTQMGVYFRTEDIAYNTAGSFKILVDGFELANGEQLLIFPFVLNPDSI